STLAKLLEFSFEKLDDLIEFLSEKRIFQKIPRPPPIHIEIHKPEVIIDPRRMALHQLIIFSILFGVTMYFLALFFAASLQKPLAELRLSFNTHPEAYSIPYFAFRSLLRIFFAYLIALAWTLAAGIIITRNKFLSQIFLPIFDIGQSIPALALFPFIVIIVFKYFGTGSIGLEIASVLLLLTGSQWYLLFNIIGAIKRIPKDISEAASCFGISDWRFVRYVILPAIFPGIIVGSIQAWGGAWNATIVSEYINYGGHIQFEATYSGVELNSVTAVVGERVSEINCFDGKCLGMLEVMGVGKHNASITFHSNSVDFHLPINFTVGEIGSTPQRGNPVTIPASSGYITLLTPTNDSTSPLHPYSVTGLGAFINKATAEWGDPWLITIAIGAMSLTVILLNHFVWGYLFMKAEKYKFEMT
ncbi:MAG: ABC transporter permease subunit, partial [Candidatus Micrarchaeia archaeon]